MAMLNTQLFHFYQCSCSAWALKDQSAKYYYANANYCKLFGALNPTELLKRTDLSLLEHRVAYQHYQQDVEVLRKQKPLITVWLHAHCPKKSYLCRKQTLDTNRGLALLVQVDELKEEDFALLLPTINPRPLLIQVRQENLNTSSPQTRAPAQPPPLSDRELDILFYLVRGCSDNRIADILKISFHTVQWYIKRLCEKFARSSKHELIYVIVSKGFLSSLPPHLLQQQHSNNHVLFPPA